MSKIIGIDLGTANSAVAVVEGGKPLIIPNAEGGRITPSIGAMNPKTGKRMIGQGAKRQAITNPKNTIFSAARFVGRKYKDPEVQKVIHTVPYTATLIAAAINALV